MRKYVITMLLILALTLTSVTMVGCGYAPGSGCGGSDRGAANCNK